MEIIRSHDALFRFVFGDVETMGSLLRAELPAAVVAAIDWSSLRRCDGSFVDAELRERQADLLFSAAPRGSGSAEAGALLYVLCEHKSFDDRLLPLQVARYVMRVLDDFVAANPRASRLPAVLPFVVYHGEQPWRPVRHLERLVAWEPWPPVVRRFLRRRQMRMPFHALDLSTTSVEAIAAMQLVPAAELTLRFLRFLRRSMPAEALTDLLQWQDLFARLSHHPRGSDVLVALFSWFLAGSPANHEVLRTVMANIPKENEAMRTNLDLLLDLGAKRGMQKGMQKGMEKGMQEGVQQGLLVGQRRLLGRQLRARFGDLPLAVDERVARATVEQLENWAERVLTARTLDEVFAADAP